MRPLLASLMIAMCFLLSPTTGAALQDTSHFVEILAPGAGEALQGNVPIKAFIESASYLSVEVSFAYSNDPTQTWFLIAEGTGEEGSNFSANWDTTTLTDGNYKIRLKVTMVDGSILNDTVLGLRVRNYSPVETATPTLSPTPAPEDTPVPTLTQTPTLTPIPLTATPLPTNPAQVTTGDISYSLIRGAFATVAFFFLIGFYSSARKYFRR